PACVEACDVDQVGLNARIAGLGDAASSAADAVALKDVGAAQHVLDAANGDGSSERAATTVAVGQIVGPPAGGTERDRRSLFPGITHCPDLIHELGANSNPANFSRQAAHSSTGSGRISIDVDAEQWIT